MVLTPSAGALSLDQLAQLADRIVEASPTPTISATDTHMHSQLTAQVTELTKRLDRLTSQISCAINNLSKRNTRSPTQMPSIYFYRKWITATLLVPPHVRRRRQEMSTTLPEVGKQLGQLLSATSATGHTPSRLLFLTDNYSGRRFLIDTSAEVRVIPRSPADRHNKKDCLALRAVNGSSIATFGTCSLTLDLGLRRTFRWIFVIADIHMPIIGADFLRKHGLLVNMKHGRLVDTVTTLQTQGTISHIVSPSPSFPTQHSNTEYDALLAEFPSVTKPCASAQPVRHTVTHHMASYTCPGLTPTTRSAHHR